MWGKAFPALSSRCSGKHKERWEVGRGTGRDSYGTCFRRGTKGRGRKRLHKAWELEQCSSRRGCQVTWKPLGK